MDLKEIILNQLRESETLHKNLSSLTLDIEQAARLCIKSLKTRGKVVLFGNGGSAADAQHIAAELVGRFKKERPSMPALALTTNTSALTAIANDYDYATVFSRQVQALVNKNDVVVGISTSGNSPNVIRGLKAAKHKGARTIALTGNTGKLKELADLALCVPSKNTPRIQEVHILIGHILAHLIEEGYTS